MSTGVEIANQSLAEIGDTVVITSLTQNIKSAIYANLFFTQVRDRLLSSFNWTFATKRVALVVTTAPIFDYTYAFTLPADFLKLVTKTNIENRYRIEGNILLTDTATRSIAYVFRETTSSNFDPIFVTAFVFALASHLAVPLADVVNNPTLRDALNKGYRNAIYNAHKLNAIEYSKQGVFDDEKSNIDFLNKSQVQTPSGSSVVET